MDPDETLKQILQLADHLMQDHDLKCARCGDPIAQHADDLAARIGDLDEWIRKGGFLPARWSGIADAFPGGPVEPTGERFRLTDGSEQIGYQECGGPVSWWLVTDGVNRVWRRRNETNR